MKYSWIVGSPITLRDGLIKDAIVQGYVALLHYSHGVAERLLGPVSQWQRKLLQNQLMCRFKSYQGHQRIQLE